MDPDTPAPPPENPAREWSEVVLALGLIAGLVILFSLKVDGVDVPPETEAEEAWMRHALHWVSLAAEGVAAVVIAWGVVQALVASVGQVVTQRGSDVDSTESIRTRLGRTLALGIEFTLAADILGTAVSPSRDDLLTLGVVVLLRTLLNLFLEREIREVEAKQARARSASVG